MNSEYSDEMLFSGLELPSYKMYFLNKFQYYSNYGDISENEVDYVFLFIPNHSIVSSIMLNPKEAKNSKWITTLELDKWLRNRPEEFTSWFKKAYTIVKETYLRKE